MHWHDVRGKEDQQMTRKVTLRASILAIVMALAMLLTTAPAFAAGRGSGGGSGGGGHVGGSGGGGGAHVNGTVITLTNVNVTGLAAPGFSDAEIRGQLVVIDPKGTQDPRIIVSVTNLAPGNYGVSIAKEGTSTRYYLGELVAQATLDPLGATVYTGEFSQYLYNNPKYASLPIYTIVQSLKVSTTEAHFNVYLSRESLAGTAVGAVVSGDTIMMQTSKAGSVSFSARYPSGE